MKNITFSDVTLCGSGKNLTFREKIEAARLLDKLGVGAVEIPAITDTKSDMLLIKSIAGRVQNAAVSVAAALNKEGVHQAASCLTDAKHPRIALCVPMSAVRMEYVCRMKPPMVMAMMTELIAEAKACNMEVELIADDATRAEKAFLTDALKAAKEAGADIITIADTAGTLLPEELAAFVKETREILGDSVKLGVFCTNALSMSCAAAISAIRAGADEIKVSACDPNLPLLEDVEKILRSRGAEFGIGDKLDFTRISRTCKQIEGMCQEKRSDGSPFDNGAGETQEGELDVHDSKEAVAAAVRKLGYDLSDEDMDDVYEAFRNVADKKSVSYKELDVIVASSAMQVPPTYQLESYVINAANIFGATAHIRLTREGKRLESVVAGDGPVDASFLAMEQIAGHHYELDDFQIQAVTEGREAMGAAFIRLRSGGKLYAGRGISTDILGACIRAYLNALNKIVYEEGQA